MDGANKEISSPRMERFALLTQGHVKWLVLKWSNCLIDLSLSSYIQMTGIWCFSAITGDSKARNSRAVIHSVDLEKMEQKDVLISIQD